MKTCLFRIFSSSLTGIALACIIAFPAAAGAQDDSQSRLLAKRAAKVDALRNLAETVYGVSIDSRTTVRDFVTQSDVVRARLDTVISGAREIDYAERPDGTSEVTVEITLGQVEDILGRRLSYDYRTFTATGYGTASGSFAEPAPEPPSPDVVRAKGYGVEPRDPGMTYTEKTLMAKRAAKMDALRNLAEQVKGVRISSDSYVRDFVTQSDEMRARLHTFVQGARVVSERQMPDGSYEVEVEVEMEPLRRAFVR
ncbi:MAG: LPP20 family lipoprotein [Nitrospirae bacterium]|nr:LPP20 family lipoprotein [Nitrospirota bacterium]